MKLEREMMRGAGPTAVMQLLSGGEKYGYELVESLSRQTDGVLKAGPVDAVSDAVQPGSQGDCCVQGEGWSQRSAATLLPADGQRQKKTGS